jgi:hypothetical protein
MASYSHISDVNNKVIQKNFGLPALRSGLKDGTITLSEKQQKKLQTCEKYKKGILGDRRHVKKNVVQSKYGRNYYRFYRWGYKQQSRLKVERRNINEMWQEVNDIYEKLSSD